MAARCQKCGFGTIARPDFAQHIVDVALDCVRAEAKVRGNVSVRQTFAHQFEDFSLADSQTGLDVSGLTKASQCKRSTNPIFK